MADPKKSEAKSPAPIKRPEVPVTLTLSPSEVQTFKDILNIATSGFVPTDVLALAKKLKKQIG